MKNDTQSNKLTLIDRNGAQIGGIDADRDDIAVEYLVSNSPDKVIVAPAPNTGILILAVTSAAFAAAAVAAGSYAWWLSRQRVAHEALTDVHDLLKTCQDRMSQMEQDLHSLPARLPSPQAK